MVRIVAVHTVNSEKEESLFFFFLSQIPESPLSISHRILCMLTPK